MLLRYALMFLLSSFIPTICGAQSLSGSVTAELRGGYTSNTYLNPYYSEWQDSVNTSYLSSSAFGNLFWNQGKNSLELNGGLVYQPFISGPDTWKGLVGGISGKHRFSDNFNAGIETGSSLFNAGFTRKVTWVLPEITWNPSSFTSFNLQAGSNFVDYQNFSDSLDINKRFDNYTLSFQKWFGFTWQMKARLYGNLENPFSFDEYLSTSLSLTHIFPRRITSSLGFQYQNYQSQANLISGNDGGNLPINIPGGSDGSTETISDHLIKSSLNVSYPVKDRVTAFVNFEHSWYQSDVMNSGLSDFQVSGGIRLSLNKNFHILNKSTTVSPRWENTGSREYIVSVTYRGSGKLFITGDFNNWEKPGIPLKKLSKNKFSATLNLEPGLYEYKILMIDGETEQWLDFSDETHQVGDGFGGTNAIMLTE